MNANASAASGLGEIIQHVFVLMLENRSFDHLFALSGIPGIAAATAAESRNTYNGTTYAFSDGAPGQMPTDPGHEFTDVIEQLCGAGAQFQKGSPYPPGLSCHSMDSPLYFLTPPHTKVDESVLRRNSRGERCFNAL
ncbi:hypothetical protein BH160DRAFT_5850 [Burkholderia sp. H160]|nr:hypothetical protein BH160DRAFT_5850 [Burkholderia sp. H160]